MIKRWGIYLLEMYQPFTRLVFSALSTWSASLFLQTKGGFFSWGLWLQGTLSMMLILMYYRICDEFKDYETDLKYFPERPLPSGRISFKDLHILRGLSVVSAFILNLIWPKALLYFIPLYLHAFLMGKWFFVPAMAKHRLWAFVTHSPIAWWGYLYLCMLFTSAQTQMPLPLMLVFILWISMPGMTWEVARKTRAPQNEEVGYQTYSEILGPRGATYLTLSLTLLHLVCLFWLWPILHGAVVSALILAGLIYMGLLIAFCLNFEKEHWLKAASEAYVIPCLLAFPVNSFL